MSTRSFPARAELSITGTVLEAGAKLYTQLTGRAIPYLTPTDLGAFTEDFAPGAFAESLRTASNLPLHLWHDDMPAMTHMTGNAEPIGVAASWDDRADGLHGTWRLDDTLKAQDAARQVDRGMLPFLSIRFVGDELTAEWTLARDRGTGKDHVRWTKARLISVALLSTPAYPTANVTGVRAVDPLEYAAAYDEVFDLAVALGNPMVVDAITGTPLEMRAAAGLVRSAIARFGATVAVDELAELAAGFHRTGRPQLAVNVERARQLVDPATVAPGLATAHLEYWRQASGRPADTTTPPAPARRRRRR